MYGFKKKQLNSKNLIRSSKEFQKRTSKSKRSLLVAAQILGGGVLNRSDPFGEAPTIEPVDRGLSTTGSGSISG